MEPFGGRGGGPPIGLVPMIVCLNLPGLEKPRAERLTDSSGEFRS
jgi:hypothetical protein